MSTGKISQIIGPVIDVEFAGELPQIYDALSYYYDNKEEIDRELSLSEARYKIGGVSCME